MDSKNILEDIHKKGLVVFDQAFDVAGPVNNVLGGIVETIKPTKKTAKGTDYLTTIVLREPSDNHTTINLNLFHSESKTPSQLKRNDIFLCLDSNANPRFKNYHAMKTASWAAFDGETLDKTCEGDTVFTMDENFMNDILKLYQTWINNQEKEIATAETTSTATATATATTATRATRAPPMGTGGRMILPTYKLQQGVFVDFVAMVVYYEKGKRSDMTNLLLTDYSRNPQPMTTVTQPRQAVEVDLLIQCTLFDENSRNCPDLSYGDYIYIKNALCKSSKAGNIELAVRHDNNATSDKVWRLEESDQLLMNLNQRKQQFENGEKRPYEPEFDADAIIHSAAKKTKRLLIEGVRYTPSEKVPFSFIKDLFNGEFGELHHLRVSIVDYKPKNIADISVKLCQFCGVSSDVDATNCKHCNKEIDTIIYRCALKFRDVKGDSLFATIYGTKDEPIFDNLPITNLKRDNVACERVALMMDTLCPPKQEKGPMVDICLQSYVHEDSLRFVIKKTKFRLTR